MNVIHRRGAKPMPRMAIMLIGLTAAGSIAAGTYMMKKQKETANKVKAQQAMNFYTRGAYRSIRTPSYAHITDDQVRFYGNKWTRYRMMKNAKHRLNNRFAYRSSIWDLERFLI
jgi:hypothetical protein